MKCDRCGEAFDWADDENFVAFRRLGWDRSTFKYPEQMWNGVVLCPNCMKELNGFLKKTEKRNWLPREKNPVPTIFCAKEIKGQTIVIGADSEEKEFLAVKKDDGNWYELITNENGFFLVMSDRLIKWRGMTSEEEKKYRELQSNIHLAF